MLSITFGEKKQTRRKLLRLINPSISMFRILLLSLSIGFHEYKKIKNTKKHSFSLFSTVISNTRRPAGCM